MKATYDILYAAQGTAACERPGEQYSSAAPDCAWSAVRNCQWTVQPGVNPIDPFRLQADKAPNGIGEVSSLLPAPLGTRY